MNSCSPKKFQEMGGFKEKFCEALCVDKDVSDVGW